MSPLVVGLDLSLSSTGVALADGTTLTVAAPPDGTIEARIAALAVGVVDIAGHPELVVVEDLPSARLAGGGSQVAKLGMLAGAVRHLIHTRGWPLAVCQPGTLKRYATGKGNANKDLVRDCARDRLGLPAGVSSDECDAAWLRAMGLDMLGHPVVEMPKAHRAALESVPWPLEAGV